MDADWAQASPFDELRAPSLSRGCASTARCEDWISLSIFRRVAAV
jgi:hypothetical protein